MPLLPSQAKNWGTLQGGLGRMEKRGGQRIHGREVEREKQSGLRSTS